MERYRTGQDVVVRVNKFVTDQVDDVDILQGGPPNPRSVSSLGSRSGTRAATRKRSTPASTISASPRATAISSPRSRSRYAPAARSARCAARCATSSASTRGRVRLDVGPPEQEQQRAGRDRSGGDQVGEVGSQQLQQPAAENGPDCVPRGVEQVLDSISQAPLAFLEGLVEPRHCRGKGERE